MSENYIKWKLMQMKLNYNFRKTELKLIVDLPVISIESYKTFEVGAGSYLLGCPAATKKL